MSFEHLAKYNHAFDFNIDITSNCKEGSDITGEALKEAFIDAINAIDDNDFLNHVQRFENLHL